jgi:hypothetical protein
MIDEAQDLPTKLLEEIRILSDLENRQKLLQLLLVGQPELESRLGTPEMRQLTQRLSVRCELPPLARQDVRPYVTHRLTIAGANGTLQFTDAAIDLVGAASSGTPRVINLICDRALFRAAGACTMTVDAEHVLGAVDDLKLPVARSLRGVGWDRPVPNPDSFVREWREGSAARAQRQPQPRPVADKPDGLTRVTERSPFPTRRTLLGSELGDTVRALFWRLRLRTRLSTRISQQPLHSVGQDCSRSSSHCWR